MSVDGSGRPPDAPRSRSPAARVLGAGARGAERLVGATGVDRAIEDATEEAIVRALRSPAVERAIVRVLVEENAVGRALEQALTSDEVARAVVNALDSDVADRVWEEILASPKAQMLVERIAEAPEVRAAIAQQGVGLITDVGRRLTAITEAVDDAAERFAHGLLNRPGHEAETNQVGLVTRALAAVVDLALISALLSIGSGLLASIVPAATGGSDGLSIWGVLTFGVIGFMIGGAIFVAFWALVGQTPGMRLLSIHLDADGSQEIGLRRALKRLLAIPLSLLPAGLGFLAILLSPERRGWHDRIAGTTVLYDEQVKLAPWSQLERKSSAAAPSPPVERS
ncbi:MAG TPA: RDD family protein [Thermoleophilaceae bacterium]|nr:RDD family protein [Thermoleophilaceae bacterium]